MALVLSCVETLRAVMSVSVLKDFALWDRNMGLNVLLKVRDGADNYVFS